MNQVASEICETKLNQADSENSFERIKVPMAITESIVRTVVMRLRRTLSIAQSVEENFKIGGMRDG